MKTEIQKNGREKIGANMVQETGRTHTVTNRYEKFVTVSIKVKANIANGLLSYPQARRASYTMIHSKDLHQTVTPLRLGIDMKCISNGKLPYALFFG
jgi:hypothetical protein